MRIIVVVISLGMMLGCAKPADYSWQDTREPKREEATVDLEECQAFTARQYSPGMPAGEQYLRENDTDPFNSSSSQRGEWRPDRSPFPVTNVNAQPTHDVPVDYTGYPGELDHYPDYLSDILEKCMRDRGWSYLPVPERKKPHSSN